MLPNESRLRYGALKKVHSLIYRAASFKRVLGATNGLAKSDDPRQKTAARLIVVVPQYQSNDPHENDQGDQRVVVQPRAQQTDSRHKDVCKN